MARKKQSGAKPAIRQDDEEEAPKPRKRRKPKKIKLTDEDAPKVRTGDKEKAEKPKTPKKRKRSASQDEESSGDRDEIARTIGRQVRAKLDTSLALPEYEAPERIREDVVDAFVNGDILEEDKVINRRYRAYGKGMDETFSTATTRELFKGLFEGGDRSTFTDEEWDYVRGLADILSAVRIPTEYSGYALEDSIMQHPANRTRAFFTDPYDTASEHSLLDSERREYVQRAAKAAADLGLGARETS